MSSKARDTFKVMIEVQKGDLLYAKCAGCGGFAPFDEDSWKGLCLACEMQALLDETEVISPLCADDLHEACEGDVLGQFCVCECHAE